MYKLSEVNGEYYITTFDGVCRKTTHGTKKMEGVDLKLLTLFDISEAFWEYELYNGAYSSMDGKTEWDIEFIDGKIKLV